MFGVDAEQGRRGDVCGASGTPAPTGGGMPGAKAGWAEQGQRGAGGACPAPTDWGIVLHRPGTLRQPPRLRRRAGIQSEKAGFRLKNRLIVIFEVKYGFFPPLCGCRRCLHLALPGFAALNRGPTRQTPHHVGTAGLFWYSFGHKRGTTPRQAAVSCQRPRLFSHCTLFLRE